MATRMVFILAMVLARPGVATEFWVAPGGNDADAGTRAKPFASLERARDAARGSKASQTSMEKLTIWLRGGDYFRTNALELNPADSGTLESPVMWRAYRDEPVRLLGGRTLTAFKPVADAAVLARLDEKARGHIVEVNLRALGLTDFGEMKSRGFGRSSVTAHCELFYRHRPMVLARWPNEGEFAKIAGYPAAADYKDEHGGNLGELREGFKFDGDRPGRWQDTSDLWVHGYWAYDWANSYEKVASLDVEQHLVKTVAPYGQYGFRKNQRFYFLNILEELDQPRGVVPRPGNGYALFLATYAEIRSR
jgi:hypothetical protein